MSDPNPATPIPQRSTLTADYQRDWKEYYAAVAGMPPRDTLIRALDAFEAEDRGKASPVWRKALDIACGEGRDTREMLRRGGSTRWKVMASDSTENAINLLSGSIGQRDQDRVFLVRCAMEELPTRYPMPRFDQTERPVDGVDLANASFALPFCIPSAFGRLWTWIESALKPGGRFAGQFFGDRDEWACVRPKSHFTKPQVEHLFRDWTIEHLEEVEKEGDDAMGNAKYHHVFHVVARRAEGRNA